MAGEVEVRLGDMAQYERRDVTLLYREGEEGERGKKEGRKEMGGRKRSRKEGRREKEEKQGERKDGERANKRMDLHLVPVQS